MIFFTLLIINLVKGYRLVSIVTKDAIYHSNSVNYIDIVDTFPDTTINFANVQQFARMAYDAYSKTDTSDWYTVPGTHVPIDLNSIRGYIFTNGTHNVVSIKGTSINIRTDRYNDNLFLSCCFYKQSGLFKNTCDIPTDTHVCSKSCYLKSLDLPLNYLNTIEQIGRNLEKAIDLSKTIFTGHSLGGFLATYLGIRYNRTTITFEAPGTKYYFDKIDLYYNNRTDIYHFGHTADPIFTGRCNLRSSLCYIGGYVIRTRCHVGKVCTYDSKTKLNARESLWTHRMKYVINTVIPKWETDFPLCEAQIDCQDCAQWTFV